MIWVVHPDPDFLRYRIPDPDPEHCFISVRQLKIQKRTVDPPRGDSMESPMRAQASRMNMSCTSDQWAGSSRWAYGEAASCGPAYITAPIRAFQTGEHLALWSTGYPFESLNPDPDSGPGFIECGYRIRIQV
jgi:hypothetical protein